MIGSFQNILAVVNLEASDEGLSPALRQAVRLTTGTGGKITVAGVLETYSSLLRALSPSIASTEQAQAVQAQARLDKFAQLVGGNASTALLRGDDSEIAKQVLRSKHDLVVKDASLDDGGFLNTADQRLLRRCPGPVWIERPGDPQSPLKVLAAINAVPGDDAHAALNHNVLDVTERLRPDELHIVHAWKAEGEALLRAGSHISASEIDLYVKEAQAQARSNFQESLNLRPDLANAKPHLIKGNSDEVIIQLAETLHPSLIVLGTVARHGMKGLLIGNTAETVLRKAKCSILAVKPDAFVSPITLA